MALGNACLFNLIVYTEDPSQLDYLNEIIQSVVFKYPARVIVIHGKLGEKDEAPNIQKTPITNQEFKLFDRIDVTISQKCLSNVSLFVLPYLIPDYPIYLFFSGNPSKESPVFNALIILADRLIVDSVTSHDLSDFCSTMIDQVLKKRIEICDINWARISGWRQILSSLFDNPTQLPSIKNCKLLQIIYESSDENLPINQALYLQAWLASRLKWTFKDYKFSDSLHEIWYLHEENPILVQLIHKEVEKKSSEGVITTVQITTGNEQIFDIMRMEDQPQVRVYISSLETCDLPYSLYFPNFYRGSSYLTQLLYSTTSRHYCEMLPYLHDVSSFSLEKEKVFIGDTSEIAIDYAVSHLIDIGAAAIQKKGRFTLALSGGSTPKAIFQSLAKSKSQDLDWGKVYIFYSDERCVPPTSDESNYKMAMTHGIEKLGIPESQIFRMKGEINPKTAAAEYEECLKTHVPDLAFDLIMLGVGEDGHTASLFPDTEALSENNRFVVANWVPKLNVYRITFTFPLINRANHIHIYVLGKSKEKIVKSIFTTEDQYPIQRVNPNKAFYILDRGSAANLI